jgi:hypothetical protein
VTDEQHDPQHDPRLRDLLDSSFGDGPPPPSPADRLAPGRRALRRRRVASGAVSVTAVAALVLGAGLLTGGDGARAVDPLPVATGTATGTATPDATPTPDGAVTGAYQSELCLTFEDGVPSEQDLNDLDLEYDPGTETLEPVCDLGGAPVGEPLITVECLALLGERADVPPGEQVPVRYDRDAGFAHLAGDTPADYDPRCAITEDVAVEPTPQGSR